MDLISTYAKLIRPRRRSIILFLVSIMTFVWRAGTADERTGPTASFAQALAPRIIISAVLAVGALYFVLVVQTFARYGDLMDRRWRERVQDILDFFEGLLHKVQDVRLDRESRFWSHRGQFLHSSVDYVLFLQRLLVDERVDSLARGVQICIRIRRVVDKMKCHVYTADGGHSRVLLSF